MIDFWEVLVPAVLAIILNVIGVVILFIYLPWPIALMISAWWLSKGWRKRQEQ